MYRHPPLCAALFLALVAASGCKKDESPGPQPEPSASEARGQSTYTDQDRGQDGQTWTAERPEPQQSWMEVRAETSATFSVSDPGCELDALGGSLLVLFEGDAQIDSNGAYVSALTLASFETPSGCTVPEAELAAVTGITARMELPVTVENCQSYCDAKARAEAEQACEGDVDEASCRTDLEATYSSDCQTTCTTTAFAIGAETTLDVATTTAVGADLVATGALGSFTVDLMFEELSDDSGQTIPDDGRR